MSAYSEREQALEGLDLLLRLDREREQRLSLLDCGARPRRPHTPRDSFDIALAGLVAADGIAARWALEA
jgi:hypothetical protein